MVTDTSGGRNKVTIVLDSETYAGGLVCDEIHLFQKELKKLLERAGFSGQFHVNVARYSLLEPGDPMGITLGELSGCKLEVCYAHNQSSKGKHLWKICCEGRDAQAFLSILKEELDRQAAKQPALYKGQDLPVREKPSVASSPVPPVRVQPVPVKTHETAELVPERSHVVPLPKEEEVSPPPPPFQPAAQKQSRAPSAFAPKGVMGDPHGVAHVLLFLWAEMDEEGTVSKKALTRIYNEYYGHAPLRKAGHIHRALVGQGFIRVHTGYEYSMEPAGLAFIDRYQTYLGRSRQVREKLEGFREEVGQEAALSEAIAAVEEKLTNLHYQVAELEADRERLRGKQRIAEIARLGIGKFPEISSTDE